MTEEEAFDTFILEQGLRLSDARTTVGVVLRRQGWDAAIRFIREQQTPLGRDVQEAVELERARLDRSHHGSDGGYEDREMFYAGMEYLRAVHFRGQRWPTQEVPLPPPGVEEEWHLFSDPSTPRNGTVIRVRTRRLQNMPAGPPARCHWEVRDPDDVHPWLFHPDSTRATERQLREMCEWSHTTHRSTPPAPPAPPPEPKPYSPRVLRRQIKTE